MAGESNFVIITRPIQILGTYKIQWRTIQSSLKPGFLSQTQLQGLDDPESSCGKV